MHSLDQLESKSVWSATESMPHFFPLSRDLHVDVCVVGGGIGGLTTAYMLLNEGKKVCLLESAQLASGQSARTTAHFCTALDQRYFELEKIHGETRTELIAQSHRAAIGQVESIVRAEYIDCELTALDGYLFSRSDPRTDVLERELNATLRAGISHVEVARAAPLASFDTGICLKFPHQMQLHPLKYMVGLARCIVSRGGLVFTDTHVSEVHGGKAAYVKTMSGHTVHCESVVVATNTPINDLFAIHTKQAAYRTYVMAFAVPKGSVHTALYWDTLNPFHYIRVQEGQNDTHDILIVGGEDHKTGQDDYPEARFDKLEAWTRVRFPMASVLLHQWSGQVMQSSDGLAYLGHNPLDRNNVYVITGDSGNGMTSCTIGAILITDQIMGRENPWEELYKPSRISLKATGVFVKEMANVVAQYGDWLAVKPKPDLDILPRGEGTVFRSGMRMIAVYKNDAGATEWMSAACPHLGGVVAWNNVEKSWDCPCHGSRFDAHGKVIEGPANEDLKTMADPATAGNSESIQAAVDGEQQPIVVAKKHGKKARKKPRPATPHKNY